MNRLGVAVLVLLATSVGLSPGCGGQEPPEMEGRGRGGRSLSGDLVYQRGEKKRSEIWVMNLASRQNRRLTQNDVLDEYPRWSPDGEEIAFYSDRNGTRQIYIMDSSGKNLRKITGAFPVNEDPSWSPDGKRLCFWAKPKDGGREDIFLINRDGGGLVNITNSEKGTRRVPAWSPDGGRIAFTSNKYLSHQIYIVDITGENEKRLTTNPRGTCRARWAPDGKRLAYSDGGYGLRKSVDIWEMDPGGGDKRKLTQGGGSNYDAVYSPGGDGIIFSSNRTGHYELYVMDRDGGNETRLTYFKDFARYPDWRRAQP